MPVYTGAQNIEYTWMAFIDGENLTIRAQNVAAKSGVQLIEGRDYKKDCFVWLPGVHATGRIASAPIQLQTYALRAYYYTSLVGDTPLLDDIAQSLWQLGFNPQVFKRDADQRKAKGVDIALTKDMLSHAFLGHYEVAVLVAGDGDYVPLVEQVKRFGKLVYIWFFEAEGLSPKLKLASDWYRDLTPHFIANWKAAIEKRT